MAGGGSERLTTFYVGGGQSRDPRVEVTGPSIRTIQKEDVALAGSDGLTA